MSLEVAYLNVLGIAGKMGISDEWNIRSSIHHIDVFSTKPNYLNYTVRFTDNSFTRTNLYKEGIV